MKIAHVNAQRSMAAIASIEVLVKDLEIDIVCIQEPYVVKNNIRGFSTSGFTKLRPHLEDLWVVSIIANNEIGIFQLGFSDTQHVMCFQVILGNCDFYVINAYCQFSLELEPILCDIESIIKKLNNNRIIVVMDANAKSRIWHADETDERGKILEEFLFANKLYVINEIDNPSTYFSTHGESNIDVTIVSESMINFCKNWKVIDGSVSDHNLILFDVKIRTSISRNFIKHDQFNIKKANWEAFGELLRGFRMK